MIGPEKVGYQIRNYPTISISLIKSFLYRFISFIAWDLRPFKIMNAFVLLLVSIDG